MTWTEKLKALAILYAAGVTWSLICALLASALLGSQSESEDDS